MADPMSLSSQYQDRLNSSTRQFEELPNYVSQGIRIPGMISQNRILGIQAQEAQDSLTVSQQLQKSVQNPHGIMGEFGELKSAADMRKFMAKHAAISISPVGRNLLSVFDKIATATEDAEQHSVQRITDLALAKQKAERRIAMINQGLNPDIYSDNVVFNENQAFDFAAIAAKADEKSFDPSFLEPGWIDANGSVNKQVLYSSIAKMPMSETLQSRELIAQMRVDAANNRANQGQAPVPSMFEREILFREQRLGRKLTAEEFKVYDDLESGVRPKASVGLDRSVLKDKIDRKKELQKQMDGLRNLAKTTAENVDEMKQIRQAIQAIDSEIDAMVGSGADAPSNPRLEPLGDGKFRYLPK